MSASSILWIDHRRVLFRMLSVQNPKLEAHLSRAIMESNVIYSRCVRSAELKMDGMVQSHGHGRLTDDLPAVERQIASFMLPERKPSRSTAT